MKKTLTQIAVYLFAFFTAMTGQAFASHITIDGILGVGEWLPAEFIMDAADPNEALIPDSHDIAHVSVIQELDGGGGDGLYILLTTYGAPSLADLDAGPPAAVISFAFDFNGDVDFTDAEDRTTSHTLAAGFDVFTGPGVLVLDGVEGTHFKLGGVVEYFIPLASFSGGTLPFPSTTHARAVYDNGGDPPDDRIPDALFLRPIPEPGTLLLITFPLLGLAGFARRFKI